MSPLSRSADPEKVVTGISTLDQALQVGDEERRDFKDTAGVVVLQGILRPVFSIKPPINMQSPNPAPINISNPAAQRLSYAHAKYGEHRRSQCHPIVVLGEA